MGDVKEQRARERRLGPETSESLESTLSDPWVVLKEGIRQKMPLSVRGYNKAYSLIVNSLAKFHYDGNEKSEIAEDTLNELNRNYDSNQNLKGGRK